MLPTLIHRPMCLIAMALSLVSVTVGAADHDGPYIPSADSVVLDTLPVRRDPDVRLLRAERQQLATHPQDPVPAAAYARHAIEIGRTQSDPRFYGYAAAALSPWDSDPKSPVEIQWLRTVLQQQRHDFSAAMAALDEILSNNDYAPAHLTRASLLMVQGRPREALRDCAALARSNMVTATTCAASAGSLIGRAVPALATLDSIIPRLTGSAADERQWTMSLAAEIAARLELNEDANRRFDVALTELDASGKGDAYLLAAYADFMLDQHQPQRVIDRLQGLERIDTLLLRLTLAEQQLQALSPQPDFDNHRIDLIARFDAVRARGESTHGREETMFVLDIDKDPVRALSLAENNWQVQREPIDARLLLEAALFAHRPPAAQTVLDWMKTTTVEDPVLKRLAAELGAS